MWGLRGNNREENRGVSARQGKRGSITALERGEGTHTEGQASADEKPLLRQKAPGVLRGMLPMMVLIVFGSMNLQLWQDAAEDGPIRKPGREGKGSVGIG